MCIVGALPDIHLLQSSAMEIVWLDMCHICIEFSTRDCLADVPIVSDMLMYCIYS